MSGMDVVQIRKNFPKLQMMGGINKRMLAKGKKEIDAELEYKCSIIPHGGYIPHVDHFVPPDVSWENFLYYRLKLKEIFYNNPIKGQVFS
jgi:uroporphyrinogen decarboxylase